LTFRWAEKSLFFVVDIKYKIWRNKFWSSGKTQNWREEILAVEEKFHFRREEILVDFGGFLVKTPNSPKFLLLR